MSRRVDFVLNSSLIPKGVAYRLLVPDVYDRSNKAFPVLYLLHGLFGAYDNWTTLTGLDSYIDEYLAIVVMPDGGDEWYTDAVSGDCYESYLIHELIPEIDRSFRTRTDRAGRIVAGNSMGGYGAFKFGLKYANLFGLAGSFSGAFHAPNLTGPSQNANWDELGNSISKSFGAAESRTRMENDIDRILGRIAPEEISTLPYFYFDCGTDDGFLEINREMQRTLLKFGILHEYHEFQGGHDWQYWNSRIGKFLDLAAEKLDMSKPDNW